jgi:DnaJ-class molecular chaperone
VIYTHYDYLEVAPGAPSARIEAAYARVLERFNYGMTPAGQDLSGLVRMIHSAYQVLSDPQTRDAYDAQLQREAELADQELRAVLDRGPATLPRRVQDVPAPLNAIFSAMAA